MFFDYLVLAWNNLTHKKLRSWLTVIGIFIGVMTVVSLISLGDGLKTAITSQFGISSTEVITIQAGGLTGYGPPGSGAVDPLTADDADAIGKLSTIKRTIKRNIPSGKLKFNDKVGFGFATNVPDGDDRKFVYEQIDVKVELGRLLRDGDVNKVMLGYNFIKDKKGFDKGIRPGDTILLQDKKFEVVGIAKKAGSFIFDNIVLMNEKPLKDLMGYGDDVDLIVTQIKDKSLMSKAKEDIEKLNQDAKLNNIISNMNNVTIINDDNLMKDYKETYELEILKEEIKVKDNEIINLREELYNTKLKLQE